MNNFWDNRRGEVTEAQDYLRATDSVSRPAALLLSLAGFLVVFAIVFSMFLGGRWLFGQLGNNDNTSNGEISAVQDIDTDSEATFDANLDVPDDAGVLTINGDSSVIDSNGSVTTNDTDITEDTVASTETPEVSTTIVAGEATVPEVSKLPRTGPGSTLVAFVAVAFVATLAHNKLSLNKR